jgi:pilus assembly protein Flp/PilA
MFKLLRKFRRDQSGVTAIEYALIGAVVGIGILASTQGLQGALIARLGAIVAGLNGAN